MAFIKKYFKEITAIVIIILLFLFLGISYQKISNMNTKMQNYEKTIAALNDTIKVTVNNGFTEYSKQSPEIDIKELTKSEYFKTLSEEQQKFYKEIKKMNGVIASTKADLEMNKILLDSLLAKNSGANVTNDSIAFKRGTELVFEEKDTTKNLQWTAMVNLDSVTKFEMIYDYDATIQTSYVRKKDESIVVSYKINDPDLRVNNMQNFIIPTKQRTKTGEFFYKNRKVFRYVGSALLFTAGAVGGGTAVYYLSK